MSRSVSFRQLTLITVMGLALSTGLSGCYRMGMGDPRTAPKDSTSGMGARHAPVKNQQGASGLPSEPVSMNEPSLTEPMGGTADAQRNTFWSSNKGWSDRPADSALPPALAPEAVPSTAPDSGRMAVNDSAAAIPAAPEQMVPVGQVQGSQSVAMNDAAPFAQTPVAPAASPPVELAAAPAAGYPDLHDTPATPAYRSGKSVKKDMEELNASGSNLENGRKDLMAVDSSSGLPQAAPTASDNAASDNAAAPDYAAAPTPEAMDSAPATLAPLPSDMPAEMAMAPEAPLPPQAAPQPYSQPLQAVSSPPEAPLAEVASAQPAPLPADNAAQPMNQSTSTYLPGSSAEQQPELVVIPNPDNTGRQSIAQAAVPQPVAPQPVVPQPMEMAQPAPQAATYAPVEMAAAPAPLAPPAPPAPAPLQLTPPSDAPYIPRANASCQRRSPDRPMA